MSENHDALRAALEAWAGARMDVDHTLWSGEYLARAVEDHLAEAEQTCRWTVCGIDMESGYTIECMDGTFHADEYGLCKDEKYCFHCGKRIEVVE